MSKTFVAVFIITKGIRIGGVTSDTPMTGFFGSDFWHAVEFSRNGRAPVEVFRPVAGQPLHAMSATPVLSKTDRACVHVRDAPGPAARASGSRGGFESLRTR